MRNAHARITYFYKLARTHARTRERDLLTTLARLGWSFADIVFPEDKL